MRVAELKRLLQQRGISFAGCIEKSDLIERLETNDEESVMVRF
jgi:ARMET, C-terminal